MEIIQIKVDSTNVGDVGIVKDLKISSRETIVGENRIFTVTIIPTNEVHFDYLKNRATFQVWSPDGVFIAAGGPYTKPSGKMGELDKHLFFDIADGFFKDSWFAYVHEGKEYVYKFFDFME